MQFSQILSPSSNTLETAPDSLTLEQQMQLSQDYISDGINRETGTGNIVVGDEANNFPGFGSEFGSDRWTEHAGLPSGFKLNGGLIASLALSESLADIEATGPDFVEAANGVVRRLYVDLDMIDDESEVGSIDPPRLFTGYLSQVAIGEKEITITSVGDVMVWVDGEHVAGIDGKAIDNEKAELTNRIAELLTHHPDERDAAIDKALKEFAKLVDLPDSYRHEMFGRIVSSIREETIEYGEPTKQKSAYKPVDDVATLDQIREKQNPKGEPYQTQSGLYYYGAIDGTRTWGPDIKTTTIPTKEIKTLVISSDGMRPTDDRKVRSLDDLEAVHRYADIAAVAIADPGTPLAA